MKKVKQFYEEYPYPLLPIEKKSDLTGKMHANVMRNILETAKLDTPKLRDKHILDAGCGTGEKALYFALHGAKVKAFDFSSASIERAKANAKKFKLKIDFECADFEEWNEEKKFDHVFCLGVLHHTEKPREYFSKLCRRVKKGGTITIGLYNFWGRMQHRIHRKIIQFLSGESSRKKMDYVSEKIYKREFSSLHETAFVADKYANPHESYHTLEQTARWLEEEGFEAIGVYPKTKGSKLFTQLKWLFKKNGFYIASGRKKRARQGRESY
ncbi:methyltransferase domain-containing protein [Candidatus Micrarchaeota archaeon]|nr:methyltransferase domain-containing protein [Candidatus Micrarchaeota archaeon]